MAAPGNLPAAERSKIAATLRLAAAAGGAGDAERLAAIAAAERLLARHALALPDLVVLAPAPHREPLQSTWRETCARLAERPGSLRQWEIGFVADLPRFRRLSSKQRYILDEIARRVLGAGVAQ